MKKFLLATALAFAPMAPLAAQEAPAQPAAAAKPDVDPALWVVRDDDTTIYLFGTFHMLDGRSDWFNDEVSEAFGRSQELVTELVLPDNPAEIQQAMMPLVTRLAIDPQGRKISSELTEAQNGKLNELLAAAGVPAGAFDRFEPWYVNMTLASVIYARAGHTGEHGAEATLKQAANARNLPHNAVETLEGQLTMLDGTSRDLQLEMLRELLDNVEEVERAVPRMIAAWNSGNPADMDEILNESFKDNPELRRALLGARNEAWAEWIDRRLDQPGTVFMGVGAAHLVGADSVQNFLAHRNIRAERVPSQTPNG